MMSNSNFQSDVNASSNAQNSGPQRGRGRGRSQGRGRVQAPRSTARSSFINPGDLSVRQQSSRGEGHSARHVPHILQRQSGHHPPPAPPHSSRPTRASDFHPLQGPPSLETYVEQCNYLERVAREQIPRVLMTPDEIQEKQAFVVTLARLCEEVSTSNDSDAQPQATLKAFGSFVSGFATKGSDVDLAVVSAEDGVALSDISLYENNLPRRLEKFLLKNGIGARLLTRTRVPILRVCEKPTPELLAALRQERERWDALPNEQKYHGLNEVDFDRLEGGEVHTKSSNTEFHLSRAFDDLNLNQSSSQAKEGIAPNTSREDSSQSSNTQDQARPQEKRSWLRSRKQGPLDFPKAGVGVTSDINFSNMLVHHNTELLRCYSQCDERVKLMILFVKAWVERRKINSAYSGTLSSYGYVLMVLHFLINVAKPSVVPNLQVAWYTQPEAAKATIPHSQLWLKHYDIRFFRDIDEIQNLASQGRITQNRDPLPVLLRNFFHYFARQGPPVPNGGFGWRDEVISIRTPGGLLTKEEKEWTSATTEIVDGREVRQRYLFAIEDPFEREHNVARVVTHPGLVTIRDEFRRAWNILQSVGRGQSDYPNLFEEVLEPEWEDDRAGKF